MAGGHLHAIHIQVKQLRFRFLDKRFKNDRPQPQKANEGERNKSYPVISHL